MQNFNGTVAAIGRLGLAAIFLWSGFGKLMGHDGTVGYIASAGLPFPEIGYWLAVIVEIVGGIALVVGYQTRTAAAALAMFTLVAGFAFHNLFGDLNQTIHFMKNAAIVGGLLQVVALGAGTLSLDRGRELRTA